MKRLKFLAVLTFVAFAIGASADWAVYWEVNGAYDIYTMKEVNFKYATISAVDSSDSENPTLLYQYGSDGKKVKPEVSQVYSDKDDNSSAGPLYSGTTVNLDPQSSSIDYFLVELYGDDSDDDPIGWRTYSMLDAVSHIWNTSASSPQNGSQLTVSGVVPEPTSSLLMILGMAALALRRRHA